MSKISAGYMVVGGLICSALCGMMAVAASNASNSPATDLQYDILKFIFIGLAIVSMGCFAYGASKFTNAK